MALGLKEPQYAQKEYTQKQYIVESELKCR